jgi:DDE superfamily endonuclease
VFTSFVRGEQRANGGLYLRGLMLGGLRKSMQPVAERLEVDHQRLQQFITSSTWDYVAVRRRGRGTWCFRRRSCWMTAGISRTPDASPGAARQYTGTAGKVTNCQVAVRCARGHRHLLGGAGLATVSPAELDDECAVGAEGERIAAQRARPGPLQDPPRAPDPAGYLHGPMPHLPPATTMAT